MNENKAEWLTLVKRVKMNSLIGLHLFFINFKIMRKKKLETILIIRLIIFVEISFFNYSIIIHVFRFFSLSRWVTFRMF